MAGPLPILTYPAASLKKPSVEVKDFNARLRDFVSAMFETMYVSGGIGLAAPQVGENIALFVMDAGRRKGATGTQPGLPGEKLAPHPLCLLNPKIVGREGEILFEEGCLSCPDLLVKVERSRNIVVRSFDAEGRPQEHALNELEAVCAQHENDHLLGILLTDRISRLKREMYAKQRIRERKDAGDKGALE